MTNEEILNWINNNIKPKVSPETMRNYFHLLKDNYVHIDTPIPNYPLQIANADLDSSLQITVTHNLGTTVPDLIMLDEANQPIYDEYYQAQIIDEDNTQLTFLDNIPATGNGYYSLAVIYITDSIPASYNQVFSSAFDAWTAGEPDNFTVTFPALGSPTIADDSDRAVLTADGSQKVSITPVVTLDVNRNYRITVKLDVGNLIISSGSNTQSITEPGTFSIILTAGATSLIIKQGNAAIATIDTLLIEEEL